MPSKIEWTDVTVNSIFGCSPISIGCKNCYAKTRARLLANNPKISEEVREAYKKVKNWDGTVHYMGREWFEEKVKKIPTGSRVFVCSMGDLFHENVKGTIINEIWMTMYNASHLTFQILTKRPERLLLWTEIAARYKGWPIEEIWPDWIWLGTTIENDEVIEYRKWKLLDTPASIHFISCEPLLGSIDIRPLHNKHLHQVIVGGETGQGWRLGEFKNKEAWFDGARSIRDQCYAANIPFFFKKPPGGGKIGEDGFTLNTPEDLKIREFPK